MIRNPSSQPRPAPRWRARAVCGWLAAWLSLACQPVGRAAELAVVEESGARGQRINLVFLAEGYTAAQMPAFATDVAAAVEGLFGREPWHQYRSYCNVYRIESASAESGCDHGATSGPDGLRDTWFETGFYNPAIPQWVVATMTGEDRAYALLNEHVPEYDIAVILVNDAKYGGSGGPIAVVTTHALGVAVIEHELGHSFALLADEYDEDYPDFQPQEAPNNTALTERARIRWNHWIETATPLPTPETTAYAATVGLFEGSMYRASGWYRPHYDSVMRRLNRPCGAVNREQLVLGIYQRTGPLDDWYPDTAKRLVDGAEDLEFTVISKQPPAGGGPLATSWRIDGTSRPGVTGDTLVLRSEDLGNGPHAVAATVRDLTPFVRLDPAGLLEQTVVWELDLANQPPATLTAWRAAYGPDLAEPAGDGWCNLLKYALGLPPDLPAPPEDLPRASLQGWENGSCATLTVPRRTRRADVTYTVETSADLTSWASGPGHTVVVRDDPTLLVVRDAQPLTGGNRRFIRLKITAAP